MVQIELTSEEVQVLVETLEYVRSELRMEIADTDSGRFRQGLKHERDVLDAILKKLRAVR
ncbi:MAG TPA: hypothetical protein VNK95_17155 [Caldilineaceae bacterium]|nr:hypothetical protein [Caldilineaceae bacterium]